jgi:predicted GIY-YIG superfamily endonuclease
MFYVYVLKDPAGEAIYIGFTTDLKQRFRQHQKLPAHKGWKLVYYEAYLDESDARKRERMLKHYGSSLAKLKTRIHRSIMAAGHEWAGSQ